MELSAGPPTIDTGSQTIAVAKPVVELSPHTRRLLQDPIVPMLLRMAWPNILIMVAQAATGLIETWWIACLGTDALAGMALALPPVMLMQMLSAGAMGGGISAAIARALGRGRRDEADALVLHAVVINVVLGVAFTCAHADSAQPARDPAASRPASLTAAPGGRLEPGAAMVTRARAETGLLSTARGRPTGARPHSSVLTATT